MKIPLSKFRIQKQILHYYLLLFCVVCFGYSTITFAVVNKDLVALVIGNATYKNAPLANPVNDAEDIASTLRELGFFVIYEQNINHKKMENTVRRFADLLTPKSVGLFYFAGHGVQVDGRNYLIPIASNIKLEREVKYRSMDAAYVLELMEQARNRLNVVILDACRNNPFAGSFRSANTGLASVRGPIGSMVAYATAPGSVAEDGAGRNGIYTKHLLRALKTPGLPIEGVFKRVRNGVMAETDGRQTPWEESSLRADFYFLKNKSDEKVVEQSVPSAPEQNAELRVWQGIRDSENAKDFEQFLRTYPHGDFASYARQRIASLGPNRKAASDSDNKQTPIVRGTEPTLAVADIALTHPAARLVYTPEAIRSMVIAELHRQTSMQIIEASRFDSVMSEHKLEWSDLVDDQDNRGNIQSKLNNDYFLVVDVSMYGEHLEYKSSAFSKKRRQISNVVLNVQLLDARSNEVRKVARAEAQKSLDVTKSMAGLGPSKGTNPRLAVDVFEIAVRKAVAKLKLAPAEP